VAIGGRASASPSTLISLGGATRPGLGTTREFLSLQGQHAGIAAAVEGGTPFLEMGPYQIVGARRDPTRQVLGLRNDPLTIAFESGMSAAFYQAVSTATSLNSAGAKFTGEVLSVTPTGTVVARLSFQDAVITEVQLPKLEAGSKDGATFSITMQPAAAQFDGRTGSIAVPAAKAAQKRLMANQFRLRIPSMDDAADFIESIEPVKIRTVYDKQAGRGALAAVGVEVSTLVARVSASRATSVYKWFDDFSRQPTPDRMPSGTLEFVSPTRKEILASVDFQRLGILKVKQMDTESGVRTLEVELYCEGVKLNLAGLV